MLSEVRYLVRSKFDGRYLLAHPVAERSDLSYLLVFREYSEALSYLNQHAAGLAERFVIESVSSMQLKATLKRWGFSGIGWVEDPWVPRIRFLSSP
ncbi:MAG: hypothetical protein HC890_07435 [Chloroflexaceae bacterium]|nr:hypothetical protein [Chloroflexaceae bacterium]